MYIERRQLGKSHDGLQGIDDEPPILLDGVLIKLHDPHEFVYPAPSKLRLVTSRRHPC